MTAQEPNPSSPFRKPPPRPQASEQNPPIAQPSKRERTQNAATGGPPRFTVMHGLLVIGVLLVIAIGWFAMHSAKQSGQITSSRSGDPRGSVTPPVREAKPRLSEAERRSAAEALQALKALQSVTVAGVNYREYSPRVLDAKILVDRYVQSDGGDAEAKRNVQDAMNLYVFASSAWNTKITEHWAEIVDDPRIDLCPPVKTFKDEATASQYLSRETVAGIRIANSMTMLWACATAKIAEIERTLKER